ncbi:hypothetical protein HHK36_021151 [Tetracentron sinense]|uniref:Large ribosomal subunit protein bL28m n=1 Tax=Tetracentron sinense TaxID=13715 RepID=A0A835D7J8_TETSI|nr:hypothetical protein HHK36_021151 [Tetracentron sinense]
MAFRSKEMFKKIIRMVGEENLAPGVKESLKKCLPDSKVVMGRAKRGIYAGRHIQFGNQLGHILNPLRFETSLVYHDGYYAAELEALKLCKSLKEKEVSLEVDFERVLDYHPIKLSFLSKLFEDYIFAILYFFGLKVRLLRKSKFILLKLDVSSSLLDVLILFDCFRTRRNWKPNVQEKRLFSYIIDRHIRVKVTTHALRCIDKAGGIDEYLLKTPYNKMDTEMGLFWKAKIEKMYEELGEMEVTFFSPEDEAKFEQGFKDLKLDERTARRESRRKNYSGSRKQKQIGEGKPDAQVTEQEGARIEEGKHTS